MMTTMTKTEMRGFVRCMLAAAFAACVCGCDRLSNAGGDPETRARNSSVFANAVEDYQAGRVDAAVAGFEQVLKDDPSLYLAHFQLATILQDVRKDYMGALVHYRAYLDSRPDTDKTTLAQERSDRCRDLLVAEYAQKAGAAPRRHGDGAEYRRLEADNTRLAAENERLKKENKNLRYLVSNIGESKSKPGRAASLSAEVKKLLAELRDPEEDGDKPRRRTVIPTDAELLDDDGSDRPAIAAAETKKQIADAKREDASSRPPPIVKPPVIVDNSFEPDPKPAAGGARGGNGGLNGLLGGGDKKPAPSRPDTYVVQPGDTLMTIAVRFYGSRGKWRDIRNANQTTIPADGRVKVGQSIKLP